MGEIILIGIVFSILFYEMTDISPGGIIVPGFMVLYINQIDRIVYTLVVSIITYLIVQLISKYFIVYGKRKFAMMIILSFFVNIILSLVLRLLTINMLYIDVIGYTIAGLVAYEMSKQGSFKTITGLVIVVGLLQLFLFLLMTFGVII